MYRPMPAMKSTKVEAETSIEPTDDQQALLVKILGRPLTEAETNEIVFTVTGTTVPYSPGTYWEPPEGGYVEDVSATYEGKNIDDLFEGEDDKFDKLMSDAWEEAGQNFKDGWEAHLEDEADDRRLRDKFGF